MKITKSQEIQHLYNCITQLRTIQSFDVTELINKMYSKIEEIKAEQ